MSISKTFTELSDTEKVDLIKATIIADAEIKRKPMYSFNPAYSFVNSFEWVREGEPVIMGDLKFYLFESLLDEGHAWLVFHVEGDESLFKIEGIKDNYNGDEWYLDTINVVTRVPKIVYEYVYVETK